MAMSDEVANGVLVSAPGTERPRRYRPMLRYELIGCGLHGHELLGTDAAELRPEDGLFAREAAGMRWYRCLRCDSWVVLSPPDHPAVRHLPSRGEITLPLRGRPLRDRDVLRLIALDRLLHFLVLSALAAALFLFASNNAALNADFTRILKDLQGGLGGPVPDTNHGIVNDVQRLFTVSITNLYLVAIAVAAYAALEGVEAVGLWLGRRWAEYLTFIATVVFVPYEIYELTKSISALKRLAPLLADGRTPRAGHLFVCLCRSHCSGCPQCQPFRGVTPLWPRRPLGVSGDGCSGCGEEGVGPAFEDFGCAVVLADHRGDMQRRTKPNARNAAVRSSSPQASPSSSTSRSTVSSSQPRDSPHCAAQECQGPHILQAPAPDASRRRTPRAAARPSPSRTAPRVRPRRRP